MIYRLTANLFIPDDNTLRLARDYLRGKGDLTVNVQEGEPNEERSWIRVEECYHDEAPRGACQVIWQWEKPRT